MKQSPGYHSSAGAGVVGSRRLAGELPARSPDPGTGRAGASASSPAGLFREMPEAAWLLVEAITAKAPPKPDFGSACNGCGFCCAAEPCGVARQFVPGAMDGAPCPAMEFEHGRFWCGMVRRPGHYLGLPAWGDEEMGAMIGEALGAGKGCCADVG
ncbi:hypothetical protein MPEAHAMD_6786 [Methylobacterium frigidaeris]|uniref:Uncharacterized protein n=1 Tax=Methylobacterium frigidaeris TaxID=2038277 RepID=A0AA37HIN9_9HYPH|nr:hypothetical protein MPEAHAMD_6786 [Methylobacterium frigidaeris]